MYEENKLLVPPYNKQNRYLERNYNILSRIAKLNLENKIKDDRIKWFTLFETVDNFCYINNIDFTIFLDGLLHNSQIKDNKGLVVEYVITEETLNKTYDYFLHNNNVIKLNDIDCGILKESY